MSLFTFHTHQLVQRLPGGGLLAEALLFPEFNVAARNRAAAARMLAERIAELLQELPAGEIYRRRLAAPPEARTIDVALAAPVRSALWREPLNLAWHYVYWQPAADAYIAFVPALAIEVLAETAEQLLELLPGQIRSALARRQAEASLRELTFLQRTARLRVLTHALEVELLSPKQRAMKEAAARSDDKPVLPEVGTELVAEKLAPIYERTKEVLVLAQTLSGRRARSVLLVGASGVGKTALVHELARTKSAHGLASAPMWSTSGARLIAGMSGFGMWQERCHRLVREAEKTKAIVHLDNLVELNEVGKGGGSAQGFAAVLRGAIERGTLLAVAECTPEQYALLERSDPQLIAAFERQNVAEPPQEDLAKILAAVARAHAPADNLSTSAALDTLLRLHRRFATYSASPGRPLRFLRNLLADASTLPRPLGEGRGEGHGISEVTAAFARETGLPLFLLDDAIPLDLAATRDWFAARVLGQPEPVDLVIDLLAGVKAGLTRGGKPIASLLFIGPTGVGKTEMAKSLAAFLYRDAARMVRFDMSEYGDPAAVERLIGGGGSARGLLTQKLRDQPFTVVLFDEFEKAHPLFFDLLLQILGEGRLTDSAGRLADFSNAVVIMTSNLGAQSYRGQSFGFSAGESAATAEQHFAREVRAFLRPELVNRIDRVVPFAPLDQTTMTGIARRELEQVLARDGLRFRGITLDIDDAVAAHLAENGFDPRYGARPLKRAIERTIIAPLALRINEYAGETPLAGALTLSAGRVSVSTAARDLSKAELVTQWTAQTALEEITSLRRRVDRLERSPGLLRLRNEITRIELSEQQAARRSKQPPQQQRSKFRFTKDMARLARWRGLVERSGKLSAEISACEGESLQRWHGGGLPDVAALRAAHSRYAHELSSLQIELLERESDAGKTVRMVFFSEYWTRLQEVAGAYRAVARARGWQNTRYWWLKSYRKELDAEENKALTPKDLNPLLAFDMKAIKEREEDAPAKTLQGFCCDEHELDDTPPGAIGLAMELTGEHAFLLLGPETGIHRFVRGSISQDVLVGTTSGPLRDYPVPGNIARKGAIGQQPLRRTYNAELDMALDVKLKEPLRMLARPLADVVRAAVEECLANQAWTMVE